VVIYGSRVFAVANVDVKPMVLNFSVCGCVIGGISIVGGVGTVVGCCDWCFWVYWCFVN